MCESNVFLAEGQQDELFMEDVGWIEVENGQLLLKDIEGEARRVEARLQYADLVQHRVVLEPVPSPARRELLTRAVAFHGHRGPFLLIGLRIGLLAKQKLPSTETRHIRVDAHLGTEPPISCAADGLQLTTGATVGNGNLRMLPLSDDRPSVVVRCPVRSLRFSLTDQALEAVRVLGTDEAMAAAADRIQALTDEQLLRVEEA